MNWVQARLAGLWAWIDAGVVVWLNKQSFEDVRCAIFTLIGLFFGYFLGFVIGYAICQREFTAPVWKQEGNWETATTPVGLCTRPIGSTIMTCIAN